MSRFRVHFPLEIMMSLDKAVLAQRIARREGIMPLDDLLKDPELPSYRVFVENLMKSMATPAEEFHHATTGVSGEAGELLDISKKVWIYNKPMDPAMCEHIIEEMGDLRFYYQALLNLFNLTDEQVQAANVVKLSKRYHEGKYSDKQAQERADKSDSSPAPLSAAGATGSGSAAPRKFMGQPLESAEGPGAGAPVPSVLSAETPVSDSPAAAPSTDGDLVRAAQQGIAALSKENANG